MVLKLIEDQVILTAVGSSGLPAAARRHSSAISSTARAPAGARGILRERLGDVATGIKRGICRVRF